MRERLVDQLARFLTLKDVTFLADLLETAHAAGLSIAPVESRSMLTFVDRFWGTPAGDKWLTRVDAFVDYFGRRPTETRRQLLQGPIRTGEVVRHTKEGESRERLREAFNAPLHPMILVANQVMQEGLDLHLHCRRVIHHDLEWNPAALEQRVGRLDRLGSLISTLRERDPAERLEILYPLIDRTIDQRMFRRVKQREKWLEFLLGAEPRTDIDTLTDEALVPLPPSVARKLAIELAPKTVPSSRKRVHRRTGK